MYDIYLFFFSSFRLYFSIKSLLAAAASIQPKSLCVAIFLILHAILLRTAHVPFSIYTFPTTVEKAASLQVPTKPYERCHSLYILYTKSLELSILLHFVKSFNLIQSLSTLWFHQTRKCFGLSECVGIREKECVVSLI